MQQHNSFAGDEKVENPDLVPAEADPKFPQSPAHMGGIGPSEARTLVGQQFKESGHLLLVSGGMFATNSSTGDSPRAVR